MLAGAKTAAEVLEAREFAGLAYDAAKRASRLQRAKSAHDDLIAAAHRAQADALEIEATAKRRLADEYDAAQARGEVARLGSNQTELGVPNGNTRPATASELGMSRKFIHDARLIRDAEVADPGIVRRTLPPSASDPIADLDLLEDARCYMGRKAMESLAEADRLDALCAEVTATPANRPQPDFDANPHGDPH
ncbi:hypothetical protein [Phaeovulum sp. NW3]|uniref:hypothetical protein n=1 Tax=Phaeovulum sp. NW3 TaxID=2934933 RepID=UPI002020E055|nr:hypothetical protein [Phaeovulum sp. NW3]MCL7466081.1 hypothetical protein [Phaeovulum sp. NW3]